MRPNNSLQRTQPQRENWMEYHCCAAELNAVRQRIVPVIRQRKSPCR